MGQHDFAKLGKAMAASQLRMTALNDPRMVEAMGRVPRDRFDSAARFCLAYLDISQPLGSGLRALAAAILPGFPSAAAFHL